MGYRSSLYIKADIEHKIPLLTTLHQTDLLQHIGYSEDEHFCYVEMHDLKWYSNYADVNKINDFVNSTEGVGMIRTGEEGSDVEEYGDLGIVDMWPSVEVHIEGFDDGNLNPIDKVSLQQEFPEIFL